EAALRTQATTPAGDVVAVYDLGGTSFDIAVMRRNARDAFELMGEPGHLDRLGGADFDDVVFRVVAGRSGEAFDTSAEADPERLQALSALRRECATVKETLSFRFEESVSVPGMRSTARVVRSELE